MVEDGIFWYKHNCPHCGKVKTGFYAEPFAKATFTCGLCGNDLYISSIDHENREMECVDMDDLMDTVYKDYFDNRETV